MSKQINFFATESDKILIRDILSKGFGRLICVPWYKAEFYPLDNNLNECKYYLSEDYRKKDILYHTHKYYDGRTSEILSDCESPVLEYFLPFKNSEGAYVNGRFYCCSDDTDFSKKVSKFFAKIKKEFWYVKKWKMYVSKNIDVENSLFFIPNSIERLTKEDLGSPSKPCVKHKC